ncbi:hypothetical protein NBRC111894_2272 [Sporolactobacillus inulinus]|jgi:hypothetical protein|uniref:Uncharacterized protein n=1 Tax=Sporolactobacillus inulinus TaxID=2078 RepID=A0A4Y1ZDP8_9BACL|nr:hypothetical protein NBRC111894_2272 [Sporolactobacillus inulinus]
MTLVYWFEEGVKIISFRKKTRKSAVHFPRFAYRYSIQQLPFFD